MNNDLEITCLDDPYWKKGGQHVGVQNRPVQVKHIPTGITAICGTSRTAHFNKRTAIEMIEYGLLAAGEMWHYERLKEGVKVE